MLWLFLIFLLVLAGVIAYAGDVIGRRIGRKHYRLFGLRPRTTALIYAIGSGVLISLVSVLAFAALNSQALRNILEADSLRGEVGQLKGQVNPLRAEVKRSQNQLEGAQTQLRGAQTRLEAAVIEVQKLSARQKEVLLDKAALEREVSTLEAVKNDLAIRTVQLEESTVQLEESNVQLETRAETLEIQLVEFETQVKETSQQLTAREASLKKVQAQYQAEYRAGREQLQVSGRQLNLKQKQLQLSRENLTFSKGQLLALTRQKTVLEQRSSESLKRLAQLERESADLEIIKAQLEGENRRLSQTLSGERTQAFKVRSSLSSLQARSSTLQTELAQQAAEVQSLKKTRDATQAELRKLGEQRAGFERQNGALQSNIEQLKLERGQLQTDLNRAGGELEAQRTGEFVYRKNDLVFQVALERIDRPTLDAALQKALRQVSGKGAKGSLSSVLSPEQKTALIARMKGMEGRSLLVLRSATNTIAGSAVTFQAEAVSNALIFPRAQPIRSKLLAVGEASEDLRGSITRLEDTVLETLYGAGVPPENVLEGGMGEADIFELMVRLKNLGGSVMVGIAAREDVRPSSSVELYPIILR